MTKSATCPNCGNTYRAHDGERTAWVPSRAYKVGDAYEAFGMVHRIVRFEPYQHPTVDLGEGTRIAHVDTGYDMTFEGDGFLMDQPERLWPAGFAPEFRPGCEDHWMPARFRARVPGLGAVGLCSLPHDGDVCNHQFESAEG